MSWFKTGIEMTVIFPFRKVDSPLLKTDIDLLVVKPDKTVVYTDDGVTTYVAPTSTTQGEATYVFTPDQDGRYMFTLSYGDNDDYTVLSYYEMNVSDSGQSPISATTEVGRIAKSKDNLTFGVELETPRYGYAAAVAAG